MITCKEDLINTKVYSTDDEVVRMYAELCGGFRASALNKIEDEYDDIVGYCSIKYHNYKETPFDFDSDVAEDNGLQKITESQIRALHREKFPEQYETKETEVGLS